MHAHVCAHTYMNMYTQAKFLLKNWSRVVKPGLAPLEGHKPHVYRINPKVLTQSTYPMVLNNKTTKETPRWNIRLRWFLEQCQAGKSH